MGRVPHRVLLGITVTLIAMSRLAVADSYTAALLDCIDRQETWLSSNAEQGPLWRDYLQTDSLRYELDKGDSADKRTVAGIVGRYESGVPGLECRQFVATHRCLQAWANHLGVPMALRWAGQVDAVSDTVKPIGADGLAEARAELINAVNTLSRKFDTSDYSNSERWKEFLHWQKLEDQLRSSEPDWSELSRVRERFYSGIPGLEFPEFLDVRDAIRKYIYVGSLADTPRNSLKSLVAQLTSLRDSLTSYNDQPSTKSAGTVATLANWLDQLDRVNELPQEMRSFHSRPNVLVQVSESFLARRFSDTVNETRPVNEMVLGTHIRGTARTSGHITADVVPSQNGARVDIVMVGNTVTDSVGRQKPVTIHSRSTTEITARKPLILQPKSIDAHPAKANASTRTQISSIVPDNRLGRRIVENVAWKRAGSMKPQSERIASQRAAERVEDSMNTQTQELLMRARRTLQEQMRGPVDRRGLIPEDLKTSSSDTHLMLTAKQANDAQFAASSVPPLFDPGQSIAARIHESAVNNTAEQAIAGLKLTDERIAEIMQELTGSVPEELQITQDSTPWSISFDWQQPATVEFNDEFVTFAVRGREFTSGGKKLSEVMEISARYLMQTAPNGVILTRQGDIEVSFPRQQPGARASIDQITFRTLMRSKFSVLFKPVIEGEGISLPGRWESMGTLRLNELSANDGWLSLGWR